MPKNLDGSDLIFFGILAVLFFVCFCGGASCHIKIDSTQKNPVEIKYDSKSNP